ncbi:hypothetical protein ATS75_06365 [Pseudoalteromonas sp. H105]|jgi:hypothetical protein|nr:hypothetical protein ATS75_06365 [Pseudoalteromonas sp. H105]
MEIKVMANAIRQLGVLHHNPYLLAPLYQEFYSHLEQQPKNFLLSYLLLPMLFHQETSDKLQRLSKSSLNTKFNDPLILKGLEKRVQDFKELTNTCMLILKEQNVVQITPELAVNFEANILTSGHCKKQQLTAAKNLAKLMNPFLVKDCYRILGIKNL